MTMPKIADLASATPREIDERNAELYAELGDANNVVARVIETAHGIAGDRRQRVQGTTRRKWGMSDDDAERIMRERIAAGTVDLSYRRSAGATLARLEEARATIKTVEGEMARLDAEFRRRGGWTRFFTVVGGHIHSGRQCVAGTIRPSTQLGWNPELSGQTEAEAIAYFGAQGHVMCTHCFRDAPVLEPLGAPQYCKGSRKPGKPGTRVNRYPYGAADCTGCNTSQTLTRSGNIRAHKPKTEAPAGAPKRNVGARR